MPTMMTNMSPDTERFFNNFATVGAILTGVVRWHSNRDHTKNFTKDVTILAYAKRYPLGQKPLNRPRMTGL